MNEEFITSLPEEASGKDYRVIADAGGYSEAIAEMYRQLASTSPAKLSISAIRDYTRIFLRLTVTRASISDEGEEFRLTGAIGELIDPDGNRTGNYVLAEVSIDTRSARAGQTVGVLRMQHFVSLPKAI